MERLLGASPLFSVGNIDRGREFPDFGDNRSVPLSMIFFDVDE
jgi:hypothetical protein